MKYFCCHSKFHFNSSLGKKVGWLTVTLSDVSLLCFSLLNIPSPNYEYIITTFWTYHHQTVNILSLPFEYIITKLWIYHHRLLNISSPFFWIHHHRLYILKISSIHHRPVEYIITILSPPFEYIMTAFWMYHYRLLNIWELAVQVIKMFLFFDIFLNQLWPKKVAWKREMGPSLSALKKSTLEMRTTLPKRSLSGARQRLQKKFSMRHIAKWNFSVPHIWKVSVKYRTFWDILCLLNIVLLGIFCVC